MHRSRYKIFISYSNPVYNEERVRLHDKKLLTYTTLDLFSFQITIAIMYGLMKPYIRLIAYNLILVIINW